MRSVPLSIISGALALALAAPAAAPAQTAGRLTVTGEASVAAVPDMATISLGVTTVAATAAAALHANSASIRSVINSLTAEEIAPRDIRTSGLSLNPNYANRTQNQPGQITGYTATNTLTITVRDVGKIGIVLDAAVRDGANQLERLSFDLSDPAAKETAARKAAVADAISRAETLARAAGVQLGPILSISEGAQGPTPEQAYRAVAAMSVPVTRGTLDVSDRVTIVWSIK